MDAPSTPTARSAVMSRRVDLPAHGRKEVHGLDDGHRRSVRWRGTLGAILLPVVVGAASDRLRTRWGGRLPVLVAGAPVAAVALVGMGFVGGLGGLAIAVAVFFAGYFVAYEPCRALHPDLVPDEVAGKGQSTQAVWRRIGTGVALVGGGLLLAQGRAAPFIVAAGLLLASVLLFVRLVVRDGVPQQEPTGTSVARVLTCQTRSDDMAVCSPSLLLRSCSSRSPAPTRR
jgi:MFS family permease